MGRPDLAPAALVLATSFGLASLAGPPPDADGTAQEGCRRCDHRGVVPCKRHSDEIHEAETRVLFCSVVAGCEDCAGSLVVDCRHCDGGPDNAAMEARRAEVAKWMEASPIERHFGRSVPRCETDHFELVVDLTDKLKEGRKKVDPHTLMHRIADDTSHVGRRVTEHYEVVEDDLFAKMRMWIWKEPSDHASAVEAFMQTSARGDFKLLGKDPVFSVWQEPGLFASVGQIRTVFTHNAGHMLISNLFRERDVGAIGGGWLDAGAGHWYEYDRFDSSVNYCIEEATAASSYANGVWRAAMRRMLADDDEPRIAALLDVPTTAMNVEQQAVCWSFYDWLVANHREKLRPILRDLKQRKPTRDVLKEHIGLGVLAAEEAWRAWVAETYPKKEKRRRR
ncbi:MAG: hypothetical protein AAGB93_01705 [Planctomycetota bacterium]